MWPFKKKVQHEHQWTNVNWFDPHSAWEGRWRTNYGRKCFECDRREYIGTDYSKDKPMTPAEHILARDWAVDPSPGSGEGW